MDLVFAKGKKRIIVFMLSLAALVLVLNKTRVIAAIDSLFGIEYFLGGIRLVDQDRMDNLLLGKTEISGDDPDLISQIKYEDYDIPYDMASGTFYISQPMEADNWMGRVYSDFGIDLYMARDDSLYDKTGAIADGKTYRLYAVKGDKYASYNLVLTGMPLVTMDLNRDEPVDWNGSEAWNGNIAFASWQEGIYSYETTGVKAKYRGATTINFEKKGYRIELEDKMSVLGMEYEDDWAINAIYDDPGLVHNQLSYELWDQIAATHESGNDYAIDQEYAEIILDGSYYGVCAIQERYDKNRLGLDENDVMFKTFSREVPRDIVTMLTWTFSMKYPDAGTIEMTEPMYEWCRSFWTEVGCRDFDEAMDMVDEINAIDYTIFNTLTSGYDSARKNIVFVIRNDENGNYKIQSIPWDQNITWGLNSSLDGTTNYVTQTEGAVDYPLQTDFGMALYQMDEARAQELFSSRWTRLRDDGIITVENIESILDTNLDYLHDSGAYDRNYKRWPNGADQWSDQYIYDFVEQRIPVIDEMWYEK